MKEFIKKRYTLKYDIKDFEKYYEEYQNIKPFKVNENIYETNQSISEEAHYILRLTATYKMKEVLEALKINLDDANVRY